MSSAPQSIVTPGQFVSILASHPRRWLAPALVVAVFAGAYALVRPATWEASQALIVRNEAAGSQSSPGKFSHSDEMKTVQETILELAGSRTVLAEALREVGPPDDRASADEAWPGDRDVDNLRKSVKLDPPKGAEFGTTEIFYLRARDRSRPRAVALVAAICGRLEARFQQLRDTKAHSMIDELVKAVNLAQDDLDESTADLKEIEQRVGSDLAELRGLEGGATATANWDERSPRSATSCATPRPSRSRPASCSCSSGWLRKTRVVWWPRQTGSSKHSRP